MTIERIERIERTSTHVVTCRHGTRVEEVTVVVEIDIDRLVNHMATRAWRTKSGVSKMRDGLVVATITERHTK